MLHQARKKHAATIDTLRMLLCSLERCNHDHTVHKTAHNKAELEEMAESVGFWWHSIGLGQGVVPKGDKTL